MPRRTITKCARRGAGPGLDQAVEFDLLHGHVFGLHGLEVEQLAEWLTHWRRWGDEITQRYAAAYPGSRPFACYVLGHIPPSTWQHDCPALRHPLRRIEGCTVEIPDIAWHQREAELEHLVQLGLVDRRERAAALERLAGPDPGSVHVYRWISTDYPDGPAPRP